MFVLVLAGCNETSSNTADKGKGEKEDISLQISKDAEEIGTTLENSEVYKELNRIITEDPQLGIENDFSIYIIDIVNSGTEDAALLLLGVNRLNEAIKNSSFDYTLGLDDGSLVWDEVEISLSEEQTGIIKKNHAVPFSAYITLEQEAIIDELTQDNQFMKIENFSFESAK